MKTTEIISKEKDILELKIGSLIREFMEKIGGCDMDINPKVYTETLDDGTKLFTNFTLDISITI